MMRVDQPYELSTKRLNLRCWRSTDLPSFAQLNADPQVMKFFPSPLSAAESNRFACRIKTNLEGMGWGLWAVELAQTQDFVGYVGLSVPSVTLPCSPCTEIGWRLAKQYWGNGYATEAGHRVLAFAFSVLKLNEVVSFTSVQNTRSRAVMERLGLVDTGENFLHPMVASTTGLQEHVLYKIGYSQWTDAHLAPYE